MFNNFKSFVYDNKSLLKDFGYMMAQFDSVDEIDLGLERTLDKGSLNRYRQSYVIYGTTYTNQLELHVCIIKNPCVDYSQEEMIFTREEIRELAKWLTSKQTASWLYFEDENYNQDNVRFYGIFTNVATYIAQDVVGLTLTFTCTSSYAYTFEKTYNYSGESTDYGTLVLENDSDELEDYVYPIIEINPTKNGTVLFYNTSDTKVLTTSVVDSQGEMEDVIKDYALKNDLTVTFNYDSDGKIQFNNQATVFTYTDRYGNSTRCVGYFTQPVDPTDESSSYEITIVQGGFMILDVLKDLHIFIDCEKTKIYDELGRMVMYSTLNIKDVDSFYWFRLVSGENTVMISAEADIAIRFSEPRKVGEM